MWLDNIDIKSLGDRTRVLILQRLRERLGYVGAYRALAISDSSLSRYLRGERRIPDEVVRRALQHLGEEEFRQIVQGEERLRAVGIVRKDGSIDYGLALQLIALASGDEYLKQAILRFAVEHFKEDLRRMLGLVPTTIKLTWDKGFEEFLRERKKRRRITTEDTLEYYRNLFKKHLEGKTLSQDLIDYVINYPVKWLRNVFRHYIQYLYYTRRISPETYGWIMEVVPSRSYKIDVRPYPINIEDLRRTMDFLRERHGKYYVVYRAMLEGGLRLSHALHMIENFSPEEVIEIPNTAIATKRLVCFDKEGFCRYYVGIRETMKPCELAYLSRETVEMIRGVAGAGMRRQVILKYARKHGLLPPKTMRKMAWRLMIKAMPEKIARFIQSRFGELRVSEARYEDLLSEADQHYPGYLEKLWRELGIVHG